MASAAQAGFFEGLKDGRKIMKTVTKKTTPPKKIIDPDTVVIRTSATHKERIDFAFFSGETELVLVSLPKKSLKAALARRQAKTIIGSYMSMFEASMGKIVAAAMNRGYEGALRVLHGHRTNYVLHIPGKPKTHKHVSGPKLKIVQ